jgi:DNA-binding beta-propeller fold protein YncE
VIQGGSGLKTGSQFVVTPNSSFTDATCAGRAVPPRLSFPAHSAPIDAVFDAAGESLFVTFHGSWDRQPATGYKLVQIPFKGSAPGSAGGGSFEPSTAADSKTGFVDVIAARDPGSCQSQSLTRSSCWRPSAVVWDLAGTRLFLASDNDAEGEVFVLQRKG